VRGTRVGDLEEGMEALLLGLSFVFPLYLLCCGGDRPGRGRGSCRVLTEVGADGEQERSVHNIAMIR
jgi:hypothetical protein